MAPGFSVEGHLRPLVRWSGAWHDRLFKRLYPHAVGWLAGRYVLGPGGFLLEDHGAGLQKTRLFGRMNDHLQSMYRLGEAICAF